MSFIQTNCLIPKRLGFKTCCSRQKHKLLKVLRQSSCHPSSIVTWHCSEQVPSGNVAVTRPLTIPLQDDTQLTFMFSYADMLQLVEKLNQLVLSFRNAAEATAQRKKTVQPTFEYYCQRNGLFIHMECNPNLFTSAFQAKVYIRVYDDKIRVHSQASLTTLMDVLRKWKRE
ncbi:Peptidyl-prolyl cis-trans isomerase CYP18-2 [Galdieria sulphuraria]|uniref:Uncharacterized protein n=1 Tax=Galdieria sulphuraria TaxID=130081 RepID=M2XQ70_GALSU|nr:hypothetical protein Gasu_04400 isoform 1 [Galdieria sulphuraria]EME32347.1 hypothetical protein isoform 1 [Galdieria sulphuraria]GJD06158.1 Peptidyl-prolyl cis-trans isomerase CYP18-2 [Galdieria sulphuraria]|eukprot:XP_005708867.1 hypothetical protein isoform 1 [Galdieria sulphuraria]